MKKVVYSSARSKKPVKLTVFVSDSLDVPEHIQHPSLKITLKKVSESDTSEKPEKGSYIFTSYPKDVIKERAEKEADQMLKEISSLKNSPENLTKLSKDHWVKEYIRVFSKQGTLSQQE